MDITIIVLRLVHIIGGTFWVGAALMLAFFVVPVAQSMGPAGGQFLQRFGASRFGIVIAISGILTVLAGFLLFSLRWTLSSPQGGTFMLGGLIALAGLIYGGAATGPTQAKLGRLGAAIQAGGKPPTPEQLGQLQMLQGKLVQSGRINAALVTVATILMAVARYISI